MKTSRNTKREIYFDFAASTPVTKEVLRGMEPYWKDVFANPRATHVAGARAKSALSDARASVARILEVKEGEIIFTSSATEANNLALLGVCRAQRRQSNTAKKPHIIISAIEHASIREPAERLKKEGFALSYVYPDSKGLVSASAVARLIKPETILISIMYVNNELGTIEPIRAIANLFHGKGGGKESRPLLHTDASQAPRFLSVSPHALGVDLLSLDGQKIYGPKGVGVLWKKERIELLPLMFGAEQERGVRPGTENLPAIVGFAKALSEAKRLRIKDHAHCARLRDYFVRELFKQVPRAIINTPLLSSVPGIVNVSLPGVGGEELAFFLEGRGILCGTGSACASGKGSPSHVLRAIGKVLPDAVRISFGRETGVANIRLLVRAIASAESSLNKKHRDLRQGPVL